MMETIEKSIKLKAGSLRRLKKNRQTISQLIKEKREKNQISKIKMKNNLQQKMQKYKGL